VVKDRTVCIALIVSAAYAGVGDGLARAELRTERPEDQRNDDERHGDEDERGEFDAGDEQHRQAAHHHQHIAQGDRDAGADGGLDQRRVGGQARQNFARARDLEEGGAQAQNVGVERLADVGDDAFADPGDEIEADCGRKAEHDGDGEHEQKILVDAGVPRE
jgi:hypothetical protein